uniref:Uncharacterized protein n=1 Tax=Cacopsylla melanoneura TaxID=428564 RepID=A0A8D8TQ71_9HEMI
MYHVHKINKKLRRLIFIFRRIKLLNNDKITKMLYYSFAQSILQYGIISWGYAYKTTIKSLCRAQNILLRIIMNKDNLYHSDLLYDEYQVLNIRYLYLYRVLYFINKNHIFYSIPRINSNTRQNGDAVLYICNLNIVQHSTLALEPKLINILPNELTNVNPFNKLILKLRFQEFIKTQFCRENISKLICID